MSSSAPEVDGARDIPPWARLALSRAAVQVLADQTGARLLHIKGDAVDPMIRPEARSGTDVDVLADPRSIPALHRTLRAHGWTVYSTFRFGSPFEHAQTYAHDMWGYLDLHRRFPGIGLADQQAFDLLWSERTSRQIAGIDYKAPSIEAQAVLLVLNAARAGRGMPSFWADFDPSHRTRSEALVGRLQAQVAFATAEGSLEMFRGRRDYLLWKVTAQGGPRIAEWWGRVRAQPTMGQSLRVIAQAPLVNTDRLARRLGHEPSRREVIMEFFARGLRGAREASSAVLRRGR